jgi:hypothetical protein
LELETTKTELEDIIKKAFKRGEMWGVTYSGWFNPTLEDTEKQIQEVLDELS